MVSTQFFVATILAILIGTILWDLMADWIRRRTWFNFKERLRLQAENEVLKKECEGLRAELDFHLESQEEDQHLRAALGQYQAARDGLTSSRPPSSDAS